MTKQYYTAIALLELLTKVSGSFHMIAIVREFTVSDVRAFVYRHNLPKIKHLEYEIVV